MLPHGRWNILYISLIFIGAPLSRSVHSFFWRRVVQSPTEPQHAFNQPMSSCEQQFENHRVFFTFFFTTCNLDTLGLVNWIPWDGQPPTPSGCWLMARCRCSDPPNSIGGDSSWDGGMHPNRYQHWQRIKAPKISSKPSVRTVIFCLVMMINPSFMRVKMLTFLLWDAWRVVWSMQASWWNEWKNDERRWSNRKLWDFGRKIWEV